MGDTKNNYLATLEQAAKVNAVSDELRIRRQTLGLKQCDVAQEAGINVVTLCRLERGIYHPSPKMFDKIVAAIARLGSVGIGLVPKKKLNDGKR